MIGRLVTLKRELGWLNTLLYAIDRLLAKVSGQAARLVKYYIVVQPVAGQSLLPKGRGKRIEVREITAEMPATEDFPRPADVIQQRYADDACCLAAYDNGVFAGYIWLAWGNYREDEVRCHYHLWPQEGLAWDFDVYIDPARRLGLAFPRLWDEANACMRFRGVVATVSRISAFNPGSLVAHTRLGAQRRAWLSFLVMGRWQLMLASVPPYIHLSTGPSSVPDVHFRYMPQPAKEQGR